MTRMHPVLVALLVTTSAACGAPGSGQDVPPDSALSDPASADGATMPSSPASEPSFSEEVLRAALEWGVPPADAEARLVFERSVTELMSRLRDEGIGDLVLEFSMPPELTATIVAPSEALPTVEQGADTVNSGDVRVLPRSAPNDGELSRSADVRQAIANIPYETAYSFDGERLMVQLTVFADAEHRDAIAHELSRIEHDLGITIDWTLGASSSFEED